MGHRNQRSSSFGGKMGSDDIEAFANIALSGDLSGQGNTFDRGLAADYLRLIRNSDTLNARFFKKEGIQPAQAPQGFFVYNYGSAGIFRRADWMVTLKGYTTDVWGSEIYTKDNRYGRYQSYGSVQIMGKGNPCHVPEAVLCRRDGIGTVCRVQLHSFAFQLAG